MTGLFVPAAHDPRPRPRRSPAEELRARIAAAHVPRARAENLRLATWNIRELAKHPGSTPASPSSPASSPSSTSSPSSSSATTSAISAASSPASANPGAPSTPTTYLRDDGGNHERVGFLFREDRVRLTGLASSAEPARRVRGDGYVQTIPWWRPPFLALFEAGGFGFMMIAAHLRWGHSVGERETELAEVGQWLAGRRK